MSQFERNPKGSLSSAASSFVDVAPLDGSDFETDTEDDFTLESKASDPLANVDEVGGNDEVTGNDDDDGGGVDVDDDRSSRAARCFLRAFLLFFFLFPELSLSRVGSCVLVFFVCIELTLDSVSSSESSSVSHR